MQSALKSFALYRSYCPKTGLKLFSPWGGVLGFKKSCPTFQPIFVELQKSYRTVYHTSCHKLDEVPKKFPEVFDFPTLLLQKSNFQTAYINKRNIFWLRKTCRTNLWKKVSFESSWKISFWKLFWKLSKLENFWTVLVHLEINFFSQNNCATFYWDAFIVFTILQVLLNKLSLL